MAKSVTNCEHQYGTTETRVANLSSMRMCLGLHIIVIVEIHHKITFSDSNKASLSFLYTEEYEKTGNVISEIVRRYQVL